MPLKRRMGLLSIALENQRGLPSPQQWSSLSPLLPTSYLSCSFSSHQDFLCTWGGLLQGWLGPCVIHVRFLFCSHSSLLSWLLVFQNSQEKKADWPAWPGVCPWPTGRQLSAAGAMANLASRKRGQGGEAMIDRCHSAICGADHMHSTT